jgi:rhamnogalacturonyl hydrolase YesR
MTRKTLLAVTVLALAAAPLRAEEQSFSDWPVGTSPQEVGKKVAENFVPRPFRAQTDPKKAHLGIIYPEACAWYGALTFARLSGDADLKEKLVKKFEPLLAESGRKMINRSAHVDYRVFGIVPLELSIQTKDKRYLDLGQSLADAQWNKPTADGITSEARYWIDDMYMIPAVQAQAFRATGETKYLDRAALAMVAYLDALQQTNGLFFHGTNSAFFWGRGNGWMAAGMTELLRSLPEDHPKRAAVMKGYRTMMASLLKYQASDGMWRQLIDDPESWPETSGSAMFTFAMITGVKSGWLDAASYGPAARKAWIALVGFIDAEGNIREVCVGTNKGDSRKYYLDRPRAKGDLHGQAPVLWSASALLR